MVDHNLLHLAINPGVWLKGLFLFNEFVCFLIKVASKVTDFLLLYFDICEFALVPFHR